MTPCWEKMKGHFFEFLKTLNFELNICVQLCSVCYNVTLIAALGLWNIECLDLGLQKSLNPTLIRLHRIGRWFVVGPVTECQICRLISCRLISRELCVA